MTGIGFQGEREQSCRLCDGPISGRSREITWRDAPPMAVCEDCHARYAEGGAPLATRLRDFRRTEGFRKVGVRVQDLEEVAAFVLQACGVEATEFPATGVEATAVLAELRERLQAAAQRDFVAPPAGSRGEITSALACALVAAAVAGVEAVAPESVDRLLMRVDQRPQMELLVALQCHARGASGVVGAAAKGPRLALLERAARGYLMGEPPPESDWAQRSEALGADLDLECGKIDDAKRRLFESGRLKSEAHARCLVDPRVAHLYIAILLHESQFAAADIQQKLLAAWLAEHGAAWPDLDAATSFNMYVRATQRFAKENWAAATAALSRYCALRPDDAAARFELAHAYLVRAKESVAREVLGSVLDEDVQGVFRDCYETLERRGEGTYLYAACLVQLARDARVRRDLTEFRDLLTKAASVVDRHLDDAEVAGEFEPDLLRLRGECEHLLGRSAEALASMQACRVAGSRESARDAWAVLHDYVLDCLAAGPERASDLQEALREAAGIVRVAFGRHHQLSFLNQLAHALDMSERATPNLDLSFGPNLDAKHPDGLTWLAYQRLASHNFIQSWLFDVRAVGEGATPIPFRLLEEARRAWQSWPADAREPIGAVVLACAVQD